MSRPVRVRFAPSPTGFLHVGGLRSALFNWLWARHNDGVFVLRIEDTDRARFVADATAQIESSMRALGIKPDEGPTEGGKFGPYVQSERLEIYHTHAQTLLETGAFYRCWCSPERLTNLRLEAQKAGVAFKYDRHCLIPGNIKGDSEAHVLRFRIPSEPKTISWDDAVRGKLEFKLSELDDFVAVKADGYPTYHFANVVDDHLMEISHVLRADEWLPSTPKHLLLFEAFGWSPPNYAHLPAVQGPTGGKKLSKRDGAQSAEEYIAEGYLPEALMSFLASLGWNDGTTQEVYTKGELVRSFSLSRVQKSPARFDKDRLIWMNGLLIRQMPISELLARSEGFWPPAASSSTIDYRERVLALIHERLKFLSEIPELTEFFFTDPTIDVDALTKNYSAIEAARNLDLVIRELDNLPEDGWTDQVLESHVRDLSAKHNLHTGHFFGLLRLSITGRTSAPGLFETMVTLGRDVTLRRLRSAGASLAPNR